MLAEPAALFSKCNVPLEPPDIEAYVDLGISKFSADFSTWGQEQLLALGGKKKALMERSFNSGKNSKT